jgi:hypothetical protein
MFTKEKITPKLLKDEICQLFNSLTAEEKKTALLFAKQLLVNKPVKKFLPQ